MKTKSEFETLISTLGLDVTAHAPDETIVPSTTAPLLGQLPRQDLEILSTLGVGGMGVVKLARQRPFNREVAVKVPRRESDAQQLLVEGYVNGRLEHPNIVPVHALIRDSEGNPSIVMKRIDGVSWLEVLTSPELAPGGRADIRWHLEIAKSVCNALRYAHEHDMVHRDVKPENVMIGAFGEVYLLDWGVAIGVAPDPVSQPFVPHRDDARGLAGTPAYMAPEMLLDDASEIDHRTDVYLLAASLFHALAGQPPHVGDTMLDALWSVWENSRPSLPASVPSELAQIIDKALSSDRGDRYPSIESFRRALEAFGEHRLALQLVDEAERELSRANDDRASSQAAIHFARARFACEQSLASWDSVRGKRVYNKVLQTQFDYLLERESLVEARGVLESLREWGVDVQRHDERLRAVEAAQDQELEGLRQYAAMQDLGFGRLSRTAAVLLLGILWSMNTVYVWWGQISTPEAVSAAHIDSTWRMAVIALVLLILFRRSMFRLTAANRRLAYGLVAVVIGTITFRALFGLAGEDVVMARAFECAMFGVAAILVGLLLDDLRIAALASLYFPVSVLAALIVPHGTLIVAAMHLVLFACVAWWWTPDNLERRWRV